MMVYGTAKALAKTGKNILKESRRKKKKKKAGTPSMMSDKSAYIKEKTGIPGGKFGKKKKRKSR